MHRYMIINDYLFPCKDMLIEVELNLLVGNVDTELFERISFEIFKTKDIKNSNIQSFIGFTENTYLRKNKDFIGA